MKSRSIATLMVVLLFATFSVSVFAANEIDPIGKWKFSAPEAPYGYNNGVIEIGKSDDIFTASMKFDGMEYKFDGESVKFAEDKLSFSIYLEGDDIFIVMKLTEEDKMTGKAIYSEGELTITAERDKEEKIR